MPETLALIVVLLAGGYLLGLGVVALVAPARAADFLLGFAGSAFAHYVELLVRMTVGIAFLVRAAHMPYSNGFEAFGWILVVTTALLFAVPWRWHRRFADAIVPRIVPGLSLIAVVSMAMGGFVLVAAVCGAAQGGCEWQSGAH